MTASPLRSRNILKRLRQFTKLVSSNLLQMALASNFAKVLYHLINLTNYMIDALRKVKEALLETLVDIWKQFIL